MSRLRKRLRVFWSWVRLGRRRPSWAAWRDADERLGPGTIYIAGREVGHAPWTILTKEKNPPRKLIP